MTLSQHPELPEYYTSSHGGWEFDINEDGDIEAVREAVLAWKEWLSFLEDQAEEPPF